MPPLAALQQSIQNVSRQSPASNTMRDAMTLVNLFGRNAHQQRLVFLAFRTVAVELRGRQLSLPHRQLCRRLMHLTRWYTMPPLAALQSTQDVSNQSPASSTVRAAVTLVSLLGRRNARQRRLVFLAFRTVAVDLCCGRQLSLPHRQLCGRLCRQL